MRVLYYTGLCDDTGMKSAQGYYDAELGGLLEYIAGWSRVFRIRSPPLGTVEICMIFGLILGIVPPVKFYISGKVGCCGFGKRNAENGNQNGGFGKEIGCKNNRISSCSLKGWGRFSSLLLMILSR